MDANINREWTRMDTNNERLSRRWRFVLKRLDSGTPVCRGFCRAAAIEYSPGLQPWVDRSKACALPVRRSKGMWDEGGKLAPDVRALGGINTPPPEHTLRSPLSGRIDASPNPGLNPWAVFCNRLAVKAADFKGFSSGWRTFQFGLKPHRIRFAGAMRQRGSTPVLPHSITPFARIRGRGRVRSCSLAA